MTLGSGPRDSKGFKFNTPQPVVTISPPVVVTSTLILNLILHLLLKHSFQIIVSSSSYHAYFARKFEINFEILNLRNYYIPRRIVGG